MDKLRHTTQELAPMRHRPTEPGQYDVYPVFPLGEGKIGSGYEALAEALSQQRLVVIDGYVGVFWHRLRQNLDAALRRRGIVAAWIDVAEALRPEAHIEAMVAPFLGDNDPIFGTRFTGTLADFYDAGQLAGLRPDPTAALSVVYGCGAALAGWRDAYLVYVDLPKNELQFRSRAASVCNLGRQEPEPAKKMYKRFYFVDWIALNRHKADLLPVIDLMIDEQRPDTPLFISGDDLRHGLSQMSQNFFRVRPWFEPGAWGGQWMRQRIPQLPQDVPNYAWSFELIVPENGLIFASDDILLEVSFDCLMYHDAAAIMGNAVERFGYEFPVRFDFLDTFDGGNLSLQCHPRPTFIREEFGETFTQDETYYILDCGTDAQVYLGFQENINPDEFRAALETSQRDAVAIDVAQFVNVTAAKKHDLFLIPSGTIHCSGTDNLVLEISATPYIFTFKMYDWMRLDLDGKPRPINIDRAFKNLRFDRKGARVQQELIAKPQVIEIGPDWQLVHLPTHAEHFYDIHRLEFDSSVSLQTDGSFHILSLVEGQSIILETANGMRARFNYAETFVVPQAAGSYRLINEGGGRAWVIKAFMKS